MFGLVSKAEHDNLRQELGKVQHALNLSLPDTTVSASTYVGNAYRSYKAQVAETSKKYEGKAAWGCQPLKNIVDLRATLALGEGVEVIASEKGDEGASKEIEFIERFITENKLGASTALAWAKEAEIEGKMALKLSVKDEESQSIAARFMPWTMYQYHVSTAADDYTEYERISWEENDGAGIKAGNLSADEFVYMKFGGRTHIVNETPTKVGSVLTYIESIDRALRDWREINTLYASPTPVVRAETKEDAEAIHTMLANVNWKIGKLLVMNADFTIAGIDLAGVQALENEIIRLVSLISGAVSIPVHFLGLPELMSNRATADNLMEVLFAGISTEREIWTDGYTEAFRKVLTMANEKFSAAEGTTAKYDPMKIKAHIPEVGIVKIQQLVDVWLALYNADALSRETLVEKMPGIDAAAELKRLKTQQEEDAPDLPDVFNPKGAGGGKPFGQSGV